LYNLKKQCCPVFNRFTKLQRRGQVGHIDEDLNPFIKGRKSVDFSSSFGDKVCVSLFLVFIKDTKLDKDENSEKKVP